MIQPQNSVSPNQLFDPFCVNDRVKTLKNQIIGQLVNEDLRAWALEHKKKFEDIPQYPFDPEEKFGKQAEAEAWKIIEREENFWLKKWHPI
jgi:hypothetical protein